MYGRVQLTYYLQAINVQADWPDLPQLHVLQPSLDR